MSSPQQYSLRWNNYFRHLTYALDNHRSNDHFIDVSLLCDGRKINAHKVVLSACSSYFKEIFTENPHPHPVIIFKFIKFEDLNAIIEFMYQGEVNVQQEALQSFLQTAELLAVQGLTSEEKEKPKPPPNLDSNKLIKSIPSTIKAFVDTTPITQTALEIPTDNMLQTTVQHMQLTQQLQESQTQNQHIQHQYQQQQQQQQQHHIPTQVQHIQVQQANQIGSSQSIPHQLIANVVNQSVHGQHANNQHSTTHHHHQQQQQLQQRQSQQVQVQVNNDSQLNAADIVTIPASNPTATATAIATTTPSEIKKRKITFSDDDNDENLYSSNSNNIDYGVKDGQTIKIVDTALLRGTIKVDIPDYIVNEVEDRLSDAGTDNGNGTDTGTGTGTQTANHDSSSSGQHVTQYTSEYEILTESEIEEKFQQQTTDANNSDITIEMGRLLQQATPTTNSTIQNPLDETSSHSNTNLLATIKTEPKSGSTSDLSSNKWTECQFCKMVITSVNLWRHVRTQHTPQPPRKCDLCNKNFKNKYSLREHIRISHEQKISTKMEN